MRKIGHDVIRGGSFLCCCETIWSNNKTADWLLKLRKSPYNTINFSTTFTIDTPLFKHPATCFVLFFFLLLTSLFFHCHSVLPMYLYYANWPASLSTVWPHKTGEICIPLRHLCRAHSHHYQFLIFWNLIQFKEHHQSRVFMNMYSGIILSMDSANERWFYIVMSSLIGWAPYPEWSLCINET